MHIARRVALTAVAAMVGWCVGWVAGAVGNVVPIPSNYPFLVRRSPMPHHVPKDPGGISFRFAMAQDVIHERFARHGLAHYRERERVIREKIRALPDGDPEGDALADDLGVTLDRLGRSDEAVVVMRDKLAHQRARGLSGRELYTTDANLGTFLIHGNFKKAAASDESAREGFREGVDFIRQSVEVNPGAHFGRERWQAAIAEFLLAAMERPTLLKTFDCLGNRLDLGLAEILNREANWVETGYGRPFDPEFARGQAEDEVPAFFAPGARLDDPSLWPKVGPIRRHITKVGAETGWEDVPVPSHRARAPFDEPMLGIIGMWRQGGGANPHFALALGETMLRVGQRHIAWAAYERAIRLADRYAADPETQAFLRDHGRRRQAEIETTFAAEPRTVAGFKPQFDAELAYGQGFQEAYQAFEAAKIAAGASIDDAHFFDDFPRRREAIASRSGPEEWFVDVPRSRISEYAAGRSRAWGIFGAGVMALATASLLRLRRGNRSPAPTPGNAL
ncbi:hypothetical protein TA3x_003590 [Tundrisphaera sp. TA3]|uniref:hypothetical protein n=1 Tax=Tundrisphaera sp. TA3 TaxID=3435775 RepID=UPI003EB8ADE6